MARFGKLPVELPNQVQVELEGRAVRVIGPKGFLIRNLPEGIGVQKKEGSLVIIAKNEDKKSKMLRGTIRSHLINMITGVSKGWQKELELVGAGYRAEVRGRDLVLTVGFSHPVVIKAPEKVSFSVEKNIIKVEGIDRDVVSQVAAKIRQIRKPEPYKGKGIRYKDEIIRKKPGKAAAKMEGGA